MISIVPMMLGLAYAIAGMHVANWCFDIREPQMRRLFAWCPLPGWAAATFSVALWPALIVAMLCMRDGHDAR